MTRFWRALSLAKEEAVVLSVATSVLLYLSAMGIYFLNTRRNRKLFGPSLTVSGGLSLHLQQLVMAMFIQSPLADDHLHSSS